ncbi:MAG: FAD-binding oxidoreductase [Tindallia sp. MSAO_Bac2]|nr:MAG: FAD-binding oxidoreductase [Tindallia sp. MSAO_Bac2]
MKQNLIRPMTDEYTEYLRDESRTVGKAETISFPASEEEIVNIVKQMEEHKTPITLQGARTGLAAGAVPFQGHVMNMSRMDKINGIRKDEAGNFYIKLQPGVILSQLRKKIELKSFDYQNWREEDQKAYADFCDAPEHFFSPDPTEASATLGGMVACNASGARSYRYGSIRPYVTALRIVLASGETLEIRRGEIIAKGREIQLLTEQGRKLKIKLPSYKMPDTKNASGYYVDDNMDAIDLFIGSDGTLGIISEIEVGLLKMPPVVWGVTCFFQQETFVLDYIKEIRNEIEEIASMEYFDGDALEILRQQKKKGQAFAQLPDIHPEMKAAAYLELHTGTEKNALLLLEKIEAIMETAGGNPLHTWVARVDVDRDRLLFFRHAIPESVNMLIDERKKTAPNITKLGTDMAVPDEHLHRVVTIYRKTLKEKGIQSAVWGHIGDNHLHVNLLPKSDEEYETGKKIYAEWAREITGLGGAVSAEHGVGKLKSQFLQVMFGEEAVNQMRELKRTFDPYGMLGRDNLFTYETEGGKTS